jgi:exopolyphosphatase/guanosine-5'-triphosphate,3'-diphosphate pyrophosphatase
MLSAVIDTGYNSTRLCIYQVFPNDTFRIIGSTKSFLRLGEDVKEDYPIPEGKVEEAEKLFKEFKKVIEKKRVGEVKLLGTSAFRYASNGPEVAKRLSDVLGVEMRVLSGEDEGKLSFLGTVNSLPVDSGVMFDLGGGSLEVVYFSSREVREVYHFRLGALKLSREVKDEKELRKKVRAELSVLKKVNGVVVGAGGEREGAGQDGLEALSLPAQVHPRLRATR